MRILFLCTGNSARSQMAEGFAKAYGDEGVDVWSAGTFPSKEVHPLAVHVMMEKMIDISDAIPKAFTSVPKPIDAVIAVCGQAAEQCPRPPGAEVEAWNLDDPAKAEGTDEDKLAVFRKIRDQVEAKVIDFLTRTGHMSRANRGS
ncbi:MAG: arsenate reductase ArsC [Fimbriimonadales bacterium]|nr:arsenate reductase ArsC [Fimbriimonadales bacterium]